jgi:integrase
VRCNTGIDTEGSGICPKCRKAKSFYISFYWSEERGGRGRHERIRLGLDFTKTKSKLRKLRSDLDEGRFDPSEWGLSTESPNSFRIRAEEWLEIIEKTPDNVLGRGTRKTYINALRRCLDTPFAGLDIASIDHEELKELLTCLPGRNTSRRTTRSILRIFWRWCRIKRYIATIPPFPTVKANDAKPKYALTLDQQFEAFGKMPEHLRDIYYLMGYVGCRVGEILTVRISDISIERRCITFKRTWSAGRIKENTKTNRPRVFPLTEPALEIVRRAIRDRVGDVYLFPNSRGKPYRTSYIAGVFTAHSGFAVPLKDATRRSWAIRMRNAGVPLDVIQKGLGHASVKTTEIYLDGDVEWARDILNKAESGAGSVIDLMHKKNKPDKAGE